MEYLDVNKVKYWPTPEMNLKWFGMLVRLDECCSSCNHESLNHTLLTVDNATVRSFQFV